MLEQIKNRIRNHSYMSQIERDEQRIQATAEHFTPTELVQKMLNSLPEELFSEYVSFQYKNHSHLMGWRLRVWARYLYSVRWVNWRRAKPLAPVGSTVQVEVLFPRRTCTQAVEHPYVLHRG